MKKIEKSEYSRLCPQCEKLLFYSSQGNLTLAIKNNKPCRKCSSKNRDFNGENNPFYGKTHTKEFKAKLKLVDRSYTQTTAFRQKAKEASSRRKDFRSYYDLWIDRYGEEFANSKLEETKKKQSIANTGINNPMYGKPPTKGVGSGWSGWYKGWYFRSFLELSYVIGVLENNTINWESAEKSYLGMPYKGLHGNDKIYFADFLVDGYLLVEIKPEKLLSSPRVIAKMMAAKKFIEKNDKFEYQIITPKYLNKEDLMLLYKSGAIKFSSKSEKQFIKYYNIS